MTLGVYIDSDVMVAAEIESETNHQESKKFMEYVLKNKDHNIKFFTSIYTFVELASAMSRRTRNSDRTYSLLYRVRNSWKRSIRPLSPLESHASFSHLVDDLIEAAIKYGTPSGDTVHAYTFAKYEMNYFITWNTKHFKGLKLKIKGIKILTPTDVLREFALIRKQAARSDTFEHIFRETLEKFHNEDDIKFQSRVLLK